MTLATALQVLQGNSFHDKGVSKCHAVIGILAALTTTVFRIVLLILSLNMGGNSIFVRLSPPEDITEDVSLLWKAATSSPLGRGPDMR